MADPQGRKWQITINNPVERGFTHEEIKHTLYDMKTLIYWCMSDEIGLETQTPHTHLFLAASTSIRFSTIKKRFQDAHIERANGTSQQNRDYVSKTGKWVDDPKSDTSIPDSFEEWGELPDEPGQGYRSDISQMYALIVDGLTNAEIMAANPELAIHVSRMDKIRQDLIEEKYSEIFRKLAVTYIWGPTETGKTRSIMEQHGYSSVYRVTDYAHPYDRYAGQDVLVYEEFRSSLMLGDMLSYLDGYPLQLPCRYANRTACYETVYIISNIPLNQQYPNVQESEPASWKAFLRRIHKVLEYRKDGPPIDHGSAMDYIFPPTPTWVSLADENPQEILPF